MGTIVLMIKGVVLMVGSAVMGDAAAVGETWGVVVAPGVLTSGVPVAVAAVLFGEFGLKRNIMMKTDKTTAMPVPTIHFLSSFMVIFSF